MRAFMILAFLLTRLSVSGAESRYKGLLRRLVSASSYDFYRGKTGGFPSRFRPAKRGALILLLVFGYVSTPAFAANIEPFDTTCSSMAPRGDNWCPWAEHDILIEGEIVQGDAQKFESALRGVGRRVGHVVLRSPGGSVSDAMAIGRLVRKLMIETEGPAFISDGSGRARCRPDHDHPNASCICASACFLIYAGGFPRAVSHVLLHRPFVDPNVNAHMSLDDSIRVAAEARQEVAAYLHEMGVPDLYANIMFSTPSNAAVVVPHRDMRDAVAGYPPEVEEWLMAQCQSGTTGQMDRLLDERTEQSNRAYFDHGACSHKALQSKRDAARAEWFGPETDAEKLKYSEEATRLRSLTGRMQTKSRAGEKTPPASPSPTTPRNGAGLSPEP